MLTNAAHLSFKTGSVTTKRSVTVAKSTSPQAVLVRPLSRLKVSYSLPATRAASSTELTLSLTVV